MMAGPAAHGSGGEEVIDLFVSYAHADDEVPANAEFGWVSTLKLELEKVLRRKLGREGARVWMDHELAANQGVTETLRRKVAASRTILIVMSPGYRKSDWCRRELADFITAARAAGRADAIFPIQIEPVDRQLWPEALLELTPIQFWEQRPTEKAPRLAGYPKPSPDEHSLYWTKVSELAHLIAQHLERPVPPSPLRPSELPPTVPPVGQGAAPQPLLANRDAAGPLQIYLHASPEDQPNAARIEEHLLQAGIAVYSTPPPAQGQTFLQCFQQQQEMLQGCDGLLLVQGECPPTNLAVAFQLALKTFGVRREGVWSAAITLPPPGKRPLPVRSPNLMQLDCTDGFDMQKLTPFLAVLRGRAAARGAGHV